MSRRKNISEPAYGQIQLKCPNGHNIGVIVVQPRRPAEGRKSFYYFKDLLREPTIDEINSPDPEEIGNGVPCEEGATVMGNCTICKRPYFQFWWEVEPLIPQLADKAVVSLILDGPPSW